MLRNVSGRSKPTCFTTSIYHRNTKVKSASHITYPSQPHRQDGRSKPTRFTSSVYQSLAQKEKSASKIMHPSHPNRQDGRSKPTRFTSHIYRTFAKKKGLPATLFTHPNQTDKTADPNQHVSQALSTRL